MSELSLQQLKLMAIFCHVIDAGSMRGAAEVLSMTPPAVSQHIRQLEQQLGIQLIHRSTRKLSLSEAGEAYYQHAKRMLAAATDASDAISRIKHSLSGELRITAPVGLACAPLTTALAPLMDEHPQLQLNIIASDERVDLLEQRVDIAIRAGTVDDSAFIYHPLGKIYTSLYASPEYLKCYGELRNLDDLQRVPWLLLKQMQSGDEVLLGEAPAQEIRVPVRMRCNNMNVMLSFACQGLGIALLPRHEAMPFESSGQLVSVLPELSTVRSEVYALTQHRQLSLKVRLVLKQLKAYYQHYR